MKRIIALALCLSFLFAFCSCTKVPETEEYQEPTTEAPVDVKIAGLMGPTGMGMTYLFDDYDYVISSDPSDVGQKLVAGEYDIAALPTNVAATLYNKTGGKIKIISVATLNVLYLIEKTGKESATLSDLKGSKIFVSGQGSAPEYVLEFLLSANGLTVGKDVTLDFTYNTHADLATLVKGGKTTHAVLPEPNVTASTLGNTSESVTIDLGAEWDKAVAGTENEGSKIAMGCIAVNTEFLDAHPGAVATFLKDYAASVASVTTEEGASTLIEQYGILPKAAVAEAALPRCNIVCITGDDMQKTISGFLKVLFEANPDSVGGQLPDENFYYKVK